VIVESRDAGAAMTELDRESATGGDAPGAHPHPGPVPRVAWFALAALTLANVAGFVDRQILSLVAEPIRRDLSLSDTQLSLLMGLGFVVVSSLLAVPLGWVADNRSRRGLLAAGAAFWSAMTVATGAARSFRQLLAARMGVGAGEAALQPAALSLIADLFPRERLGTAMSIYTLGTFVGSGVAYLLGAWGIAFVSAHAPGTLPILGSIAPWQAVYLLVGLSSFVVVPLLLMLPEPRRAGRRQLPLREVVAGLRVNGAAVTLLSLGFACSAAVNYGIAGWLATFFVRTHGWTATEAGTLQGTLTLSVGAAGALLGGRVSDALVRRGRTDGPLLVGMIGAVGMIVCAGAFPLVPSARMAAALLVPVNLFAALPWGPASAAIAEVMPERMRAQGAALSLLAVNLISGVLGPTAVALLSDRVFGGPPGLRYALATVTVIGMLIASGLLHAARRGFRSAIARQSAEVAAA
jgi:MFS family permease